MTWTKFSARLARPAHSQDNGSRAGPPDRHATENAGPTGPGESRVGSGRAVVSRMPADWGA